MTSNITPIAEIQAAAIAITAMEETAMTHVDPHDGEARSAPIRVLYVEDNPKVAEVIGRFVSRQPDLSLVNILHDASHLLDAALQHDAQVILMDLSLPGPDPLISMRQLLEQQPGVRAIVLSVLDDAAHVDECLDAGALGYFSKSDAPGELVAGIRAVMKDQVVLGSVIRQRLAMAREGKDFNGEPGRPSSSPP